MWLVRLLLQVLQHQQHQHYDHHYHPHLHCRHHNHLILIATIAIASVALTITLLVSCGGYIFKSSCFILIGIYNNKKCKFVSNKDPVKSCLCHEPLTLVDPKPSSLNSATPSPKPSTQGLGFFSLFFFGGGGLGFRV